jgi:hypothetical protein
MDPTLHLNQGLTLLEKVLKFYPMTKEGDAASVELTAQDWLVLLDFVENAESKKMIPEQVESIAVSVDDRIITVRTNDCNIAVEMGM